MTGLAAAYGEFVNTLYTCFLKSAVPTSYGLIVLAARRGGAIAAVSVWCPPGVKVSTDAMVYHGSVTCVLTHAGPVGLLRTAQSGAAVAARRDRLEAEVGGTFCMILRQCWCWCWCWCW